MQFKKYFFNGGLIKLKHSLNILMVNLNLFWKRFRIDKKFTIYQQVMF